MILSATLAAGSLPRRLFGAGGDPREERGDELREPDVRAYLYGGGRAATVQRVGRARPDRDADENDEAVLPTR
jgi:hypothetical protein